MASGGVCTNPAAVYAYGPAGTNLALQGAVPSLSSLEIVDRSPDLAVLIVDDDHATAEVLASGLGREGWRVRIAASAEEALGMIAIFRPYAVVLDLVLPFMSGLTLARRLQADPATRHLVMIALAGVVDRESEGIVREVGCAACVKKPPDAGAVSDILRAHVGGLMTAAI
jgi:CheY-like chemotaxis protein